MEGDSDIFRSENLQKMRSFLEKASEAKHIADPDKWSSGLGKTFSGPNGAQAGGGEEAEVNYNIDANTVLPSGETDNDCNSYTGSFLSNCVYLENPNLRGGKLNKCKMHLAQLARKCVFGPVID